MKKILRYTGIILVLLLLCLAFWPTQVDPVSWQPSEAMPMSGKLAPNEYLQNTERIEISDGHGPEDVAVDSLGRIYGGLDDGRILRYEADGSGMTEFANTNGRPLGLHFDAAGNLIVADSYKGLLSIDPSGKITVLSTSAEGVPFRFADDLDIDSSGVIYFSDASDKFFQKEYKDDLLEHRPNGRLLAYYPESGETRVLLKDLYFANGIAVSPDENFLLVNETWEYRITRYWLRGEKQGKSEVFIDGLPGFPDGVSCNGKDVFWVAVPNPRNALIDKLAESPFLRKVVARLPDFLQPQAVPFSLVVGLDVDGNIIHNLQSTNGEPYAFITSVEEHQGKLYLGSLEMTAIGRIDTP